METPQYLLQHVYEGHTSRIFSLALCSLSDGSRIAASGSHDRTVKIWCLETRTLLRTIDYSDFVWRVFLVIGSKGKPLVVAFISTEDKIVISDVETGETQLILFGRLVFAGLIALYPAPVVVLATGEEDISFVDVENGTVRRLIVGGFDRVFRAVVSHDKSPILVFTTWNHQNRRSTIQTYELTGAPGPESTAKLGDALSSPTKYTKAVDNQHFNPDLMEVMFEGDSRDGVSSLAVSRSKKPFICSGHYDFVVRVWDLIQRKLLFVLKDHIDWVVSVAIWKGSEPIAVSGSSDGTIKLWDLQTGALLTTCEGHLRDVWAVTVTEGPRPLIMSASVDRTMRSWDVNQFLRNIKWESRKNFCIFVYCCKLLDRGVTASIGETSCLAGDHTSLPLSLSNMNITDINEMSTIASEEGGTFCASARDSTGHRDAHYTDTETTVNVHNTFDGNDKKHCDMNVTRKGATKRFVELVFQSNNLCREIARYL